MSHESIDLNTIVREHGARLTPQRQIILDTLCAMGGHISVAELYEKIHGRYPAIDRSTIYRALSFFAEMGLVVGSNVGGVAVYEIAPHGSSDHAHLVCRLCGGMQHVAGDALDQLAGRLVAEYGFAADLEQVAIDGLCRECRAVDSP
ncbi:MAG: Fur family transcriptional regulator [Chloroflexota bacterium]|jgi:Fur family transcriptional regulator, ferric uptake regulator